MPSIFVFYIFLLADYISAFKPVNTLTAGAAYIRVFIFYEHIQYRILNMLKIKSTSMI